MSFEQPLWLLALAIIPASVWIHSRGMGAVGLTQRRAALIVRSVIVGLIVLALSGAALSLPESRLATVFVIDVSDSISSTSKRASLDFVLEALDAKPPEDLVGVVAFGREARVELSLQPATDLPSIASRPDASRSDLARAMRLAAALMPEGLKRRVVLLTDGRENSGDAISEAQRLAALGIEVSTVELAETSPADAALIELDGPTKVREGDIFQLEAEVFSNTDANEALITLRRGSTIVAERPVRLSEGRGSITFEQEATGQGAAVYRATLQASRDGVPQNDTAAALVLIEGPPRVVIVEEEEDEGANIAAALAARGIDVEVRDLSRFPTTEDLPGIDSLVLVDVAASSLATKQTDVLSAYVKDLGRGLVTVGGESSFSLGGYDGTPLEELLPLDSEIKDPERRPSIAQVITVDISGSMSQATGGTSKLDVSKRAAIEAFRTLDEQDEVGLLAFDTASHWVLDLQKLPSTETMQQAVGRLQSGGGTDIVQAVNSSIEGLRDANSALKHIILITDGLDFNNLTPTGQAVADAGMTLSVLAIGTETGLELPAMARAGGGRFYQGRNLAEIPQILIDETQLAARRYVNEGEFYPHITGSSAATERLTETPALLGYIGTSPKPSTSVLLAIGEFDDPLLATWRTGLGVVTSWTSDAKGRWSTHWIDWDGYADLWADITRETLPGSADPRFSSSVFHDQEGFEILVESESELPQGAEARARVVDPNGAVNTLQLERTDINEMRGRLSTETEGAHIVGIELIHEDEAIYRDTLGAIRSYSTEYLPGTADSALLEEVAKATGGTSGIAPADTFDPDLPSGVRSVEIGWWAILLATILLPADIALRRLLVTKQDVGRMRRIWQRETTPLPTRLEGLLASRRKSRQQRRESLSQIPGSKTRPVTDDHPDPQEPTEDEEQRASAPDPEQETGDLSSLAARRRQRRREKGS